MIAQQIQQGIYIFNIYIFSLMLGALLHTCKYFRNKTCMFLLQSLALIATRY